MAYYVWHTSEEGEFLLEFCAEQRVVHCLALDAERRLKDSKMVWHMAYGIWHMAYGIRQEGGYVH
jgi:hypothetical protein